MKCIWCIFQWILLYYLNLGAPKLWCKQWNKKLFNHLCNSNITRFYFHLSLFLMIICQKICAIREPGPSSTTIQSQIWWLTIFSVAHGDYTSYCWCTKISCIEQIGLRVGWTSLKMLFEGLIKWTCKIYICVIIKYLELM